MLSPRTSVPWTAFLVLGQALPEEGPGHVIKVSVHESKAYDPAVISRLLDDEPLPTRHDDVPLGPFLTLDGRVHRPTSDFLRSYAGARAESGTARRYASDLRGWLDFLCNVQGYHPHEDYRDPVFLASEEDFAAYWRRRQYGPDEHRLSSEGWTNARKAIKRFYEHAQRAYFHPPPFEIRAFETRGGYGGTQVAGYEPRRRRAGSAGKPLTPGWAEQLLMGALRVDLNGAQDDYAGADRDQALISLCLGTGVRRHNLAYVTTYEVPPLSDLPFTTIQVADLITKNDAGGDALTFTHRLPVVHGYMDGPRVEDATRRPYRPASPLHLLEADSRGFRYCDPGGSEPNRVRSRSWPETDAAMRQRLVNPDGTTPILFVSTLSAEPLSYSGMQHVVAGAARFVRERINPDFPPGFRLHDLRHTYAVHLAVAIYRGVLADAVQHGANPNDAWVVDHLAQAVEFVTYSLGHASEATTKLYVQTAHRFLGIPVEQFLGQS